MFLGLLVVEPLEPRLHCYRCISINCPTSSGTGTDACLSVRKFILAQLHKYYDLSLNNYTIPCPQEDSDGVGWKELREREPECRAQNGKHVQAACTVGRIRVNSKMNSMVSHATVLGCSLLSLRRTPGRNVPCTSPASSSATTTRNNDGLEMEIEQCNGPDSLCSHRDFCIPPEESVVKPFLDPSASITQFDRGFAIAIGVFVLIFFITVLAASYCIDVVALLPCVRFRIRRDETWTVCSDLAHQSNGNML